MNYSMYFEILISNNIYILSSQSKVSYYNSVIGTKGGRSQSFSGVVLQVHLSTIRLPSMKELGGHLAGSAAKTRCLIL